MADQTEFNKDVAAVTNLTPNQLRNNLRRFVNDQTTAQRIAALTASADSISFPKTPPPDPGMNLPPNPFTDGSRSSTSPILANDPKPGSGIAPYEMGENRSTTDPTAADDTWSRAGGPVPNTPNPGPFDSVVTTNPRAFFDGTNWILYFRREQYDSNGAIFAIGAELAVTLS